MTRLKRVKASVGRPLVKKSARFAFVGTKVTRNLPSLMRSRIFEVAAIQVTRCSRRRGRVIDRDRRAEVVAEDRRRRHLQRPAIAVNLVLANELLDCGALVRFQAAPYVCQRHGRR